MSNTKLFVYTLLGLALYVVAVNAASEVEPAKIEEVLPQDTIEVLEVEPQGHENTAERKTRQFGFGFPPPFYGGGFRPGFGGGFRPGFGGGFGPGPFYGGGFGGGFGRTRVITRTRYVNRGFGGGFYG